jgi:hypothetical protein
MARHVYNFFVRIFAYLLPLWLGGFELTVHRAMEEKEPQAFLAPGLMLSGIALLVPLCLASKEPEVRARAMARLKYHSDIVLIAVAFTLASAGMPIWHLMLAASLSGKFDGWPTWHFLQWKATTSIAMMYYVIAVSLAELKRLTI